MAATIKGSQSLLDTVVLNKPPEKVTVDKAPSSALSFYLSYLGLRNQVDSQVIYRRSVSLVTAKYKVQNTKLMS